MILSFVLIYGKAGKNIQDIPNERSLHDTPVPRVGGVALLAGVLSGWALMLPSLAWWLVLPLLLLFIVSLFDDMRGLPVQRRLAAHLIAAAILVGGSGLAGQYPLYAIAVLFAVVWMTNLYNFMDGSDGLAGGMTFLGFTMYGVAALMADDATFAMLNFSVSAAALGFLYFNFHPAKVFMGDAGAIPLGFLAAGMGLWGWQLDHWPAWFPVLVFSPFIADATVTLIKRAVRGVKVTEAHREHYYQHLVQMGWGHRNVALAEYALMLATGVSALWALRTDTQWPWLMLAIWAGIYGGLMFWIDLHWRSCQRRQHDAI
jgi:UDP-N-acetylmuramyl pentapeptide phosphotransferase/UDP-N-acetylglucosamine-1-phosphate transferase